MNYFLVDYENVRVAGFNGMKNLSENDMVVIFYSINADTLTFGLHRRINESKANFKFQKVAVGEKNALDFQLCSYLGFLIRDTLPEDGGEKSNYYIVSNDHGYAILSEYWKHRGTDVLVVSDLAKNPANVNEPKRQAEESSSQKTTPISELEKKLQAILPDKAYIAAVAQIINNSKTKQDVNTGLTRTVPSQKVGPIYKAIKPLIADKKGS